MFGIGELVSDVVDAVNPFNDADTVDRIKSLATAGLSVYALAEMFGLAEDVIEKILED